MLINYKNVLVLAPHTDDGELGAGATIHKLILAGSNVDYLAFSAAEDSVPPDFERDILREEVLKATSILNIPNENVTVLNYKVRTFPSLRQNVLDDLIKVRKQKHYDLILVPSSTDIHQDHKTVSEEAIRAFKQTNIWGYELIWNQLQSSSTCFVRLDANNVKAKVNAMNEYNSQKGRDYLSQEFIESLARTRGVQIGSKYAECFEIIRCVI